MSDDAILIIVELSDCARPVVLKLGYLGKVGGIDQQKAGECADCRSQQDEQNKERIANEADTDATWVVGRLGRDGKIFDLALHEKPRPA